MATVGEGLVEILLQCCGRENREDLLSQGPGGVRSVRKLKIFSVRSRVDLGVSRKYGRSSQLWPCESHGCDNREDIFS